MTKLREALAGSLTCPPNVSFAKDIAPLFTPDDYIGHMRDVTNKSLDLSSYASVKIWAHAIYKEIAQGNMPPPPNDPFTPDMVNLFACWIQQGMNP